MQTPKRTFFSIGSTSFNRNMIILEIQIKRILAIVIPVSNKQMSVRINNESLHSGKRENHWAVVKYVPIEVRPIWR